MVFFRGNIVPVPVALCKWYTS